MTTIRQLRYLDALSATGHFGRAAEAAGVSQPALSMQIRVLEEELGGALVERRPGGAALTDLGGEVARRGSAILAMIRDLEELAAANADPLVGRLRLGVIPSVAPFLLPRLIDLARREYPQLVLVVRETVTATLVEELAAGRLDAIVASLPLGHDALAEAAAFEDAFLLAAHHASPHAHRTPAVAELISADELLLLEDGHCLRAQALAVCRAIDPPRLRSFGATSLTTVLQLVAAGQGITLIPRLAVDAGTVVDPRLTLVPFPEPQPSRTLGLAWRRSSPRARDYQALAKLLTTAGAALPPA
jgi:LysR family hydrogen peroxide-inducible transcriptional activator